MKNKEQTTKEFANAVCHALLLPLYCNNILSYKRVYISYTKYNIFIKKENDNLFYRTRTYYVVARGTYREELLVLEQDGNRLFIDFFYNLHAYNDIFD